MPPRRQAFAWSFYHWVIEGIAILLMSPGIGRNAMLRANRYAMVWALITFACWLFIRYEEGLEDSEEWTDAHHHAALAMKWTWDAVLLVFYLLGWVLPNFGWSARRPASIHFSRFWFIFRTMLLCTSMLAEVSLSAGTRTLHLASPRLASPPTHANAMSPVHPPRACTCSSGLTGVTAGTTLW